jgi:uncharacterized membrane protein YqaE (UPF0057 family)
MKKIFSLSSLAIATVVMLSSCSQLTNMSLTKRHYRSGYFVDFGGNKKAETKVARTSDRQTLQPMAIAQVTHITQQVPVASEPSTTIMPVKNSIATTSTKKVVAKKHKETASPVVTSLAVNTSNPADVNESVKGNYNEDNVSNTQSSGNASGVDMTVIIICTIFIPPLGVGLKFGIDTHFWIDLILTLLFFIPGLIYGLVVVLQ